MRKQLQDQICMRIAELHKGDLELVGRVLRLIELRKHEALAKIQEILEEHDPPKLTEKQY
jgi:hypothetical protein